MAHAVGPSHAATNFPNACSNAYEEDSRVGEEKGRKENGLVELTRKFIDEIRVAD